MKREEKSLLKKDDVAETNSRVSGSNKEGEKVFNRGFDKKKHLDEWQESILRVLPQNMKCQGSAQAWRRAVAEGEPWNEETEDDEDAGGLPLNDILCRECSTPHKTI